MFAGVNLHLAALLALLLATQPSCTSAAKFDSVWHLAHGTPDLSLVSEALSSFPDLLLFLSDPEGNYTVFLPNDKAMKTWRDVPGRATAVRRQLMGNGLLYPASQTDNNAANTRRIDWLTFVMHLLREPRAMPVMVPGTYKTALGIDGIDWDIAVEKSKGSFYVQDGSTAAVAPKVVSGPLRAGKSVVYVLDAVLNNLMGPPVSSESISSVVEKSFAAVIDSAKVNIDLDSMEVPLTVFGPSDAAMQAWLSSQDTTLEDLLKDADRCQQLVQAHCMATNYGYFKNDLLALSAAARYSMTNADGSAFLTGDTARTNLLGNVMQLKANYTGLWADTLMVSFASADGGEPTAWGRIYSTLDAGGSEAGSAGVVSVVHTVDRVLM